MSTGMMHPQCHSILCMYLLPVTCTNFCNVTCLYVQVPRAYEAMVEGANYIANDITFKVCGLPKVPRLP